jgi:hypothetical protein
MHCLVSGPAPFFPMVLCADFIVHVLLLFSAPGTYSTEPNVGGVPCSRCPEGTYQPDSGKTECVPCSPGSFTNSTGALSCELCPGNDRSLPSASVRPILRSVGFV